MSTGSRAITSLGATLITALMRTTRYDLLTPEIYEEWLRPGVRSRGAAVFVLWHGRLLPCSYFHHDHGLATLISQHRDGDYISGVVERWGYEVIRGSSSRGGAGALRNLVRVLRRGTSVALTPDGPRGPRQKMKLGPLIAAQLAGVPLIPAAAGSERAWWFEGWDRFLVPKPFSRIRLAFGEPFPVPRDAGEPELEVLARELEQRLDRLTARVDEHG